MKKKTIVAATDKITSLLAQENKANKSNDMQQKQLKHFKLYFNYCITDQWIFSSSSIILISFKSLPEVSRVQLVVQSATSAIAEVALCFNFLF